MPDVPWFVYAIPFAFVGLIAVAAFYKYLQVRAAAHWPSTPGKVVVSRAEVRTVQTFDDNRSGGRGTEKRNFAKIVYEYTARGRKLRNDRVSIGEDLGNFEVAETVARYPVGTIVTVYYNPMKPDQAVLERDAPKGVWGCLIWMVVGGSAAILISFFGFNQLTRYLSGVIAYPDRSAMVVALGAMGAAAAAFGLVIHRQAFRAMNWPRVTGRIVTSELDVFQGSLSDDKMLRTLYRPLISYAYTYEGVNYAGDQASLGASVTSSSDAYAKRLIAKYPVDAIVTVYVNPENPSQAILKPSVIGGWIIWCIALALFALAWWVSRQA